MDVPFKVKLAMTLLNKIVRGEINTTTDAGQNAIDWIIKSTVRGGKGPQADSLRGVLTSLGAPKPAETEKERLEREKAEAKAIKKIGKQSTVGMTPRIISTMGKTTGGLIQDAGQVLGTTASLPATIIEGVASGMEPTAGQAFLGMPNTAKGMAAAAALAGAVPNMAAQAAGDFVGNSLSGISQNYLEKKAEQKMNENLERRTRDTIRMNITPSQANFNGRIISQAGNTMKQTTQSTAGTGTHGLRR